ncbi:MAG: hypothetical protein A3F84_12055 [Candidatus Handelsmanbacteria bacterium RIFCSPLOWO2_12_FULL_64_10]|uniref:Uncharacterized protein n=1 Tax=Handelsmanbacteria sp. (strain RIFCSPLOWO2_12_FULL_64_10) TaxID=1817868 RepID=A0A1F6D744_HANXR|nr:MAG: hypothetical protein A3F84_12055 [Candidatus Handelsmanbacteria bacterium RIFCSPLOWO2_12_FULL_64_10]
MLTAQILIQRHPFGLCDLFFVNGYLAGKRDQTAYQINVGFTKLPLMEMGETKQRIEGSFYTCFFQHLAHHSISDMLTVVQESPWQLVEPWPSLISFQNDQQLVTLGKHHCPCANEMRSAWRYDGIFCQALYERDLAFRTVVKAKADGYGYRYQRRLFNGNGKPNLFESLSFPGSKGALKQTGECIWISW